MDDWDPYPQLFVFERSAVLFGSEIRYSATIYNPHISVLLDVSVSNLRFTFTYIMNMITNYFR